MPCASGWSWRRAAETKRACGRLARRLLGLYQSGALQSPAEIAEAAYAARQMEQWKRANQLYLEAARGSGAPLWVYVDWGNLYLEKHNGAEAESIFRDALKAPQPEGGGPAGKRTMPGSGCARALKAQQMTGVDVGVGPRPQGEPGEPGRRTSVKGLLAMEAGDWKGAEDWVERGLDGNPNYVPLLELECVQASFPGARRALRGTPAKPPWRSTPATGTCTGSWEISPPSGAAWTDAIGYYREAVRKNPREWPALASLGVNLLRMAREEEGKKVLERGLRERTPTTSPPSTRCAWWTASTGSSARRRPRYWLRLHSEGGRGPWEPYVRRLLDRSISFLEEKYRHRVGHKFLVEFYPDHEDFAVRALGLPGLGRFRSHLRAASWPWTLPLGASQGKLSLGIDALARDGPTWSSSR